MKAHAWIFKKRSWSARPPSLRCYVGNGDERGRQQPAIARDERNSLSLAISASTHNIASSFPGDPTP
jgi:hypothetical protein